MPRLPRATIRARKFRESRGARASAKREATDLASRFSDLIIAGNQPEANSLLENEIPDSIVEALSVRIESEHIDGEKLEQKEIERRARTLVEKFNLSGQPWYRPTPELSGLVDSVFRKLDNLLRKGLTVNGALEVLDERARKAAIKAGLSQGRNEHNLLDLIWEKYRVAELKEKRRRRRVAA